MILSTFFIGLDEFFFDKWIERFFDDDDDDWESFLAKIPSFAVGNDDGTLVDKDDDDDDTMDVDDTELVAVVVMGIDRLDPWIDDDDDDVTFVVLIVVDDDDVEFNVGEIFEFVGNFLIVIEDFSLWFDCFGIVTRRGAGFDDEEFPSESLSLFSFSNESFFAFSAANWASISIKRFGR